MKKKQPNLNLRKELLKSYLIKLTNNRVVLIDGEVIRAADLTYSICQNRTAVDLGEVASLEKANQIHAWFVNNIQNGVDNNSYYFVTEDDFLELKEICEEVLKLNPYNLNKDSYLLYYSANGLIEKGIITKEQYTKLETELDKILPTKEGFFFGPIDYALSYFLNVKNTFEMLTKIIDNADFENEVYLYHSSW